MTQLTTSKLLTNTEAATILGLKPTTLEIWRTRGKGPKFVKLGHSKQSPIRYLESEIIAWLANGVCANTSQYPIRPSVEVADNADAGVKP